MRCIWLLTYNGRTVIRQHKVKLRSHTSMIDRIRHGMVNSSVGDTSVNDSHERKKLQEEEVAPREARTEADFCLL